MVNPVVLLQGVSSEAGAKQRVSIRTGSYLKINEDINSPTYTMITVAISQKTVKVEAELYTSAERGQ